MIYVYSMGQDSSLINTWSPPQTYTSNDTISFNKPILDPEWTN